MNQKAILLITCLVLCLLAPGVSANVLSIIPASVQHQPGETQSYTVILDSAPDGISGFNITLGIENPAVAEIVGLSYPAWASMPTNSSVPADSVWSKAVDLAGSSGTLNITLCTISVRADSAGTTNITVIPTKVEDRIGGRYTPIIVPARLVVQSPSPPPPVANFAGTPTSGPAPLPVSFTDLSLNNPTGWTWFFGDETYTQAWTQQTASAGWTARNSSRSVAMPDGSIVLVGGFDDSGNKNDVWRSTNNGTTWTQQTAAAGWSARASHSSVTMPDGSIVLMGGVNTGIRYNDVWRSTDNGATWTQLTASAGWSARLVHSSVVMPDGSIVLMGGQDSGGNKNDVWRSTDNGATWTQMTAGAGWTARRSHSSVALPEGSIVLMGGYDGTNWYNDVWRSTDNGATWTQMTAGAGWSARAGSSSVAMPDGSIVLMGGWNGTVYSNDAWRSTDNGATWTQLTAGAGWSARGRQSGIAMPDGSIVLMGGFGNSGNKNDVWRLIPTGSSARNPSHTYTAAGNYSVTLQAYNAGGYNSTRKTGYILVTGTPSPGPNTINGTIYYAGTQNATIYLHLFNQTPGPGVPAWKTKTMTYPGYPINYGFSTDTGIYWLMSYMDLNGNYTPDFNEPWGFAINKTLMQGPDPVEVTGNMTGLDITLYESPTHNETLILPDISLPSGSRKAAPIFIAKVTDASGIGFGLRYDPALIHITNITANTSLTEATLEYNINNSIGYVNVLLATTSPITTIPPMGIVNIIVEAKGSTGQQSVFSTNFAEWTDPGFDAFPLSVRQGTIRIEGIRGDFNHNGRVDIGDVTRVAYMAVGLVPYDIQADFNTNGRVDGGDAARIAWYYVGKITTL